MGKPFYQRIAHILWGTWKLYGLISTIGLGTVLNFIAFLFSPFTQALPLGLKILYGAGLFGIALAVIAICFRVLQAFFNPQKDSDSSQSVSDSPAGRDIVQAGRDVNIYTESKPKSDGIQPIVIDKRLLVAKAIKGAKEVTPAGKDVTVYITDSNGLHQIYAQELKNILVKLQDDERVITLKSFPEWLLPDELLKSVKQLKANVAQPTELDSAGAAELGYKLPAGWKLRRIEGQADSLISPRGYIYSNLKLNPNGSIADYDMFSENGIPMTSQKAAHDRQLAEQDPSRRHFVVNILNTFDKWYETITRSRRG